METLLFYGSAVLVAVLIICAIEVKDRRSSKLGPITVLPRRDTKENFEQVNPTLRDNELAVELDTRKIKLGDGITPYNSLPYEEELMPKKLVPSITLYSGH